MKDKSKLNFIFVCDYAFLSDDKKPNILGIFEKINAPSFPTIHPRMYVVTNVSITQAGTYEQEIKLIKNKKTIIPPFKRTIIADGEQKVFGFIGQLTDVKFEEAGEYKVQFFLNKNLLGETVFQIILG